MEMRLRGGYGQEDLKERGGGAQSREVLMAWKRKEVTGANDLVLGI